MRRRLFLLLFLLETLAHEARAWEKDFEYQFIENRPRLEVRYTDEERTAFTIEAEEYSLTGELRAPHRLIDAATQKEWLWLEIEDAHGRVYSSKRNGERTRINLYRRGPYFCEVHWLDLQAGDEEGRLAPLKGDLALYCYPDKLLASVTWHGVGDFPAKTFRVQGLEKRTFKARFFNRGAIETYSFPLFGETEPLNEEAFKSLQAVAPMRYDRVRGCYTIGSLSGGGFQGHFYHHPNRYGTVRFQVQNDGRLRRITICHENTGGDRGCVECGVLLDEENHPLPILVQTSKNFPGEKEEEFYNPQDTPFSETYFPLYFEARETRTLTSLHLYQNWGRHPLKQFSSLGAWMDYFHSSTGVTETTCYVPFKYGGVAGIDIADLRAMSQKEFWAGQPQHDNVAGHSFFSYPADGRWHYLDYRGTTFHSTGPNWMDVCFSYLSTDGRIRADVRTFELPQRDELRNFIRVRYEVLKPLTVLNAKENFRLLTVSSRVQRLRYKRFAATGVEERPLDTSFDHFAVRGLALPEENSFAALYGEEKGSNAIVIRSWSASVGGSKINPAVSVFCERSGDTRLLLVPQADELKLEPGDAFFFEAFFLPYGESGSAAVPCREVLSYGSGAPSVHSVKGGRKITDFPSRVCADRNTVEFILQGGRDLVPVIASGLTDYRWPRIYRKESAGWKPLLSSRAGQLDGVQVLCEGRNRFGAVFLVPSGKAPQQLRVQAGREPEALERITVEPAVHVPGSLQYGAVIRAQWMDRAIHFLFPEALETDTLDFIDEPRENEEARVPPESLAKIWERSEGGSLWFEWHYDNQVAGGRLSPNEDDVDLEFWFENRRERSVPVKPRFCPNLKGTVFEDPNLKRTCIHTGGRWQRIAESGAGPARIFPVLNGTASTREETGRSPEVSVPFLQDPARDRARGYADIPLVAVTSSDGRHLFAISWLLCPALSFNPEIPCVHADPVIPQCSPGKRVHVRGKLYLMEGTLDDLLHRVRWELPGPD